MNYNIEYDEIENLNVVLKDKINNLSEHIETLSEIINSDEWNSDSSELFRTIYNDYIENLQKYSVLMRKYPIFLENVHKSYSEIDNEIKIELQKVIDEYQKKLGDFNES